MCIRDSSGAQYCLIEEAQIRRITNPKLTKRTMKLRGVGNPNLYVESQQTATLQVTINDIDYCLSNFVVVSRLKERTILGMPFLVQNKIEVDVRSGSFIRHGEYNIREQVYLTGRSEDCVRVVTSIPVYNTGETTITANEWTPIKAKWDSH